jgi:DNA-directed RNA polymerase specialized sigma24 family protein
MNQWTLSAAAFEKLLATFDTDRERAAERYEDARSRLVFFFESRGAFDGDSLADDTLNRVARRLDEGLQVPRAEFQYYLYGVARNVLRESWRAAARTERLEDRPLGREPSFDPREPEGPDPEIHLRCVRHCIAELDAEDREVINHYHAAEGRGRAEARKSLADRLGVGLNALRIRAYRIRRRLETCLEDCLRRESE